jgi:hypothetical protein
MKRLIQILAFSFLLTGCAAIVSMFDGVNQIWESGESIESVDTPDGFSVSPTEVHALVNPMQKFAWYIYVDDKNYYLVPTQTLVPGFYANSHWAVKYGVRIEATSRKIYTQIKSSLGNTKNVNFNPLKKIVNEIYAKK